jgi:hypothetical protein
LNLGIAGNPAWLAFGAGVLAAGGSGTGTLCARSSRGSAELKTSRTGKTNSDGEKRGGRKIIQLILAQTHANVFGSSQNALE